MIVVCTLHNFIKVNMQSYRDFVRFQNEDTIVYGEPIIDVGPLMPLEI